MIRRFDRWLCRPEPNAAGRLGLFRIVYAVFYLWHLSWIRGAEFARLPAAAWEPVGLFHLAEVRPDPTTSGCAESVLAGALVLLAFGLGTRAATLAVLALGLFVEGSQQCFGKVEHGSVFLVFYLPLFMSAAPWGEAWSLDRSLGRAKAAPTVAGDLRFVWPIRAVQVVLVALFASAAASKLIVGDWLFRSEVVENLLLGKNVELVREGLPVRSVLVLVSESPLFSQIARLALLVFEGGAVALLAGPSLRDLYAALALVFHALNALILGVTFTPIAIVYAVFVDWQSVAERVGLDRLPVWPARPAAAGAGLAALVVGLGWNTVGSVRGVFNLGGGLDWRSIWYVLLPLALLWLAVGLRRGLRTVAPGGVWSC